MNLPPISQKVQGWLQLVLFMLLAFDLTALPKFLPLEWAAKVTVIVGLLIGGLKALLGIYAQRWNTDGTPQSVPLIPTPK